MELLRRAGRSKCEPAYLHCGSVDERLARGLGETEDEGSHMICGGDLVFSQSKRIA